MKTQNPAEMLKKWSDEMECLIKKRNLEMDTKLRRQMTHRISEIGTNVRYYQRKLESNVESDKT